jgi:uncharacterized membrane protein (UPF0182 family)
VIRGNLLVLPIENSTIYVEPLYLQANQSQIPELKRVILATENRLVIGNTLEQSLNLLFNPTANSASSGDSTVVSETTSPNPTPTPTAAETPSTSSTNGPADVGQIARSAQSHYDKAQEALRNGDWTGYGQEMQAVQGDLKRIVDATK